MRTESVVSAGLASGGCAALASKPSPPAAPSMPSALLEVAVPPVRAGSIPVVSPAPGLLPALSQPPKPFRVMMHTSDDGLHRDRTALGPR